MMTTHVVMLLIGIGIGIAIMVIRVEAHHIDQCADCPMFTTVTGEVSRIPAQMDSAPPVRETDESILDEIVREVPLLEEDPAASVCPQAPPVARAIDLDRLAQAESRNQAHAVSSAGARGPYQIMEHTFVEIARMMGRAGKWHWPRDAEDPGISRMIAHRYINKEIPQMLHAYGLPDIPVMRLACWNWGIGNVHRAYHATGGVLGNMPHETRELIKRYVGTTRKKL